MNKRLKITWGGKTLYDDVPETIAWQESGQGFAITAGPEKPNALGAALTQLAEVAKQRRGELTQATA